jgi:hypothetical protein
MTLAPGGTTTVGDGEELKLKQPARETATIATTSQRIATSVIADHMQQTYRMAARFPPSSVGDWPVGSTTRQQAPSSASLLPNRAANAAESEP